MAKAEEVTVGGTLFVIHPLNAFDALEIFGDLQKELLPAVGEMLGTVMQQKEQAEGDDAEVEALSKAISKLSEKLSGKQLKYWADRLITKDSVSVEINGSMMALDDTAKILAFKEFTQILELLVHVIRVNFAGPLKGFLNRFGLDQALAKAVKS